MELKERIGAFVRLGNILRENRNPLLLQAMQKAVQANSWFTTENIQLSADSLAEMLQEENLEHWTGTCNIAGEPLKTIAVVMAGNIPMVGFHDFLSVLISGNRFLGKLSSDDIFLMPAVAQLLTETEPRFSDRIAFTRDKIGDFDAVIATGSNNSAGYFGYYFSGYPHIIRKNRNAAALLDGNESAEELLGLADDIFTYFGLGCRNVSKLFLPANFNMDLLPQPFSKYAALIHHTRYHNNYTYQRAILSLNSIPYLDTGHLILKEDPGFSSPVGVVFYEFYDDYDKISDHLIKNEEKIQCVVSRRPFPLRHAYPGRAQHPKLTDYADGVNTLGFLADLHK